MWVWTVPDHSGGPHCSTEAVAEIPIESASSGSSGAMAVTNTVSLRMELARQATRSSRAARLVCHSSRSAAPASWLNRNVAAGAGASVLRRQRPARGARQKSRDEPPQRSRI